MKFEFKPEDFEPTIPNRFISPTFASAIANTKLDEWRKSWVRVYGGKDGNWGPCIRDEKNYAAISSNFVNDTHQAYLVDIEEIPVEKKECSHSPSVIALEHYNNNQRTVAWSPCKHCGIKLKSKWEAVE